MCLWKTYWVPGTVLRIHYHRAPREVLSHSRTGSRAAGLHQPAYGVELVSGRAALSQAVWLDCSEPLVTGTSCLALYDSIFVSFAISGCWVVLSPSLGTVRKLLGSQPAVGGCHLNIFISSSMESSSGCCWWAPLALSLRESQSPLSSKCLRLEDDRNARHKISVDKSSSRI